MSLLPASIKRNGWKTAEKKWRHRFSHHNPICYHGNQWLNLAEFQTHPRSHVCNHYLQVWKGFDQEQPRKSGDIVFPIISLWGFFSDVQGLLTPQHSKQAEIQTRPSSHAYHHYLQVWKGSDDKQARKSGDTVFSITTLWELSVAIETRVLIRSDPKANAAFPPTQWCFRYNLVAINPLVSEIFMFESVNTRTHARTDGPMPARLVYYKLTSEPSAQVS